ncbi:MAG: cell division protein FtsA [Candidatus Pacebacteria bacterium]|nr:cell division protein FtsA [Candidatus Paceibacterota bacterium]
MKKENPIITTLDIGTTHLRMLSAHVSHKENDIKIVAHAEVPTEGIRRGYVYDSAEVTASLRNGLREIKKIAGFAPQQLYVGVGGASLVSHTVSASLVISKADGEVTTYDIEKLEMMCEQEFLRQHRNRKVLHTVPIEYRLNQEIIHGKPIGLVGSKLEVKTLVVSILKQDVDDLLESISNADIEILDIVATPFAVAESALGKKDKMSGCALVHIGAETTSLVVYENGVPISLEVFPLGSHDITNDIALGFLVSQQEAELIKHGTSSQSVPKKKLEDIVHARLSDIFDLVDAHLKRIHKSGLLPGGVTLTGGGAHLEGIDDFAKTALRLPARVGLPDKTFSAKLKTKDATWHGVYGLCMLSVFYEPEDTNELFAFFKNTSSKFGSFFRQFLP